MARRPSLPALRAESDRAAALALAARGADVVRALPRTPGPRRRGRGGDRGRSAVGASSSPPTLPTRARSPKRSEPSSTRSAASTCSSTTQASSPRTGLPGAEIDVVHRIIDVNLKGPFHCIVAALPLLQASGGGRDRERRGAQLARRLGRRTGLCGGQGRPRRDDPEPCPATSAPSGCASTPSRRPSPTPTWAAGRRIEAGSPVAGLANGQRAADPGEVAEVIALFCSPGMAYVSGETLYMGGGFEAPPPATPPSSD